MSEQQPEIRIKPKITWTRKKIGLLIFAAVLLAGTLLFQFAAGKVRQAAEQTLLAKANAAVNGQVLVGSINLSVLGYVEAKDVQVLNAAGKPLAKIERVHIRYNWSDLLKGQLGPQLITGVTVEKPELWLAYQQNQLNWDGLLKPQTEEPSSFSGIVKILDGQLHLETDMFSKTVDQLSGQLDFQQAGQIGLAAAGKVDQAALNLDGHWGTQAASDITLTAKGLELTKLGLTAADAPIQITGGILDEFTVQIAKEGPADTPLLKTLGGRFTGVDTTGALVLNQVSAQFEKQGNALRFTNGQALYKGQAITATGQVLTAPSPANEQTLDFAVQMPSGNPAALLPGLQTGGTLTAQGKLTGSVLSPVLSGNFTLGSLQFGSMAVSGISGTFSYAGKTLKLLTATGTTIGGTVSASGDIYPDTEQYTLSISGSGLDSSKLTEKDVKGPLSLTGTAAGTSAEAVVQGSFTIYDGKAYGLSFQTLAGNFIKRGSAEAEVSNLAMKTELGVLYPEQLSQSVMERLQQRNLPTTRAEAEERVTKKITEKVFEKLF
ncbi:putative membrane protein [Propionispora sp. 2/2-37]|uniref:AsmA family protein n=1 Tax=Propionispora sp. 2/2-37 TaxID=1677858 RepID=UPI0006BB7A5A|nr:hypothetical protein [Propionispora sp. 2/2-37]CUH97510.1 putative membrane protein [Propionispora sp. 2/2-37]